MIDDRGTVIVMYMYASTSVVYVCVNMSRKSARRAVGRTASLV